MALRFRGFLERGEGVIPELVEVLPQGVDAGGVQLVQAAVAGGPVEHEVRLLQNTQVLRDRRPTHRKLTGQLTHRKRTIEQTFEDGAPGRIGQRSDLRVGRATMLVSNH